MLSVSLKGPVNYWPRRASSFVSLEVLVNYQPRRVLLSVNLKGPVIFGLEGLSISHSKGPSYILA